MAKENKVRIVMDVDRKTKSDLEEYAQKCGMSLTLYLLWCGMHKEPKAMPPEEIVKAKNLMCDFQYQLYQIMKYLDEYADIDRYVQQCGKLIKQMDRLLLDVQS